MVFLRCYGFKMEKFKGVKENYYKARMTRDTNKKEEIWNSFSPWDISITNFSCDYTILLTLGGFYSCQKINDQSLHYFNPPHEFLKLNEIDK